MPPVSYIRRLRLLKYNKAYSVDLRTLLLKQSRQERQLNHSIVSFVVKAMQE